MLKALAGVFFLLIGIGAVVGGLDEMSAGRMIGGVAALVVGAALTYIGIVLEEGKL